VSRTKFLVHAETDTVGVVVAEGTASGEELTGWIMATDETVHLRAMDEIPLGHKVALADIRSGDTVVKHGHDIGKAVADIPKGCHVHVHNLKTKRW
jgi:(2R)-sulfolactate sulfo-lyase subunit alpha